MVALVPAVAQGVVVAVLPRKPAVAQGMAAVPRVAGVMCFQAPSVVGCHSEKLQPGYHGRSLIDRGVHVGPRALFIGGIV